MRYFTYFPRESYRFGDEALPDTFTNLAVYAEIIDSVKDNLAFYFDYTIQEFERPDQASYKIYGLPDYYWTFFLLNDKLRERGWPITNEELIRKAQSEYPLTTITTRTPISTIFKIGQTITGTVSGTSAVIDHRHIDLGQIVVSDITGGTGSFTPGELITSTNANEIIETITAVSTSVEYNAAHHYENGAGETVDIDPTVGPGSSLTEITYLDRMLSQNEDLKDIRIIKPAAINQVVKSFREAIRS